jgi:DNA-directed RNA polymerase specialized sigma24 family protein
MADQESEDSPDRLGEALARLDPQSRRLVQLWLAGLGRREIAAEMRIRDEVVAVLGEQAVRDLRLVLGGDSQPEQGTGGGRGGPESAMTHSLSAPGCHGESPN